MDSSVPAKIAAWKAKGYTEEHIFAGEYVLLCEQHGWNKVRIYDHGGVWATNPHTGEYEKVLDAAPLP